MSIQFEEKWNQYSLIAELVLKLEKVTKTILQKLIYVLQEVYKIHFGYEYNFHNYGLYSEKLAEDLNFFVALEGIDIEWEKDGYKVKKTHKTEHFKEKGGEFLDRHFPQIDKVIKNFGNMNIKDLNLLTIMIYALKEKKYDEDLKELIGELNPYYTQDRIGSVYKELKNLT